MDSYLKSLQSSSPKYQYKSLGTAFSPLSLAKTPPASSSPAATGTTPTTTSPAKSNYISTLSTPSGSTVDSINGGKAYSNPMDNPAYVASLSSNNSNPSSTSGSNAVIDYNDNPPPSTPATPDPFSTYVDYLKGFQDTANTANTRLADIQNKEEQANVSARRQYQDTLDTPGMLKGGAQQAAGVVDRRNNQNLADLALQESAAARSAGVAQTALGNAQPLQIGDNYYDPSTGKLLTSTKSNADTGFTLGAGQVRYEKDPATGEYVAVGNNGSTPSTVAYEAGANPTVDSWANRIQSGQAKITDIPATQASLRNEVTKALDAMGNSADGRPTTTELGKAALNTAQGLLDKFDARTGTSAVGKSGIFDSFGYGLIPGTDRANFVTDFNSLKSQLSLEGVKYLKGQGQVSDAERALLAQAITKLSLSQSEDEFKKTLQGIISRLQGSGNSDTTSDSPSAGANSSSSAPLTIKAADGNTYGFHQDANGNWVSN